MGHAAMSGSSSRSRDALLDLLGGARLEHPRPDAVGEGPAGVAAAALARGSRHEPHDAAVVGRLVEVVVAAADEDRLEARWPLGCRNHLHRAEVRDADHADVAVAPRLGGDPLDEVVCVVAEGHAARVVVADVLTPRGSRAAQVTDDVDVVLRHDAGDVAGLDAPVPHGAGRRWGGVVRARAWISLPYGLSATSAGRGRLLDAVVRVGGQRDAVAHRDREVLVDGDLVCTPAVIVRKSVMAGAPVRSGRRVGR